MGSDAKNLMSDGNVQIVKTGEVIGATQLTEGELIVEAGGRAENTVVTGAGWLKVATGGIAKCTQYGNNGTLSVSDGAIATDIVQSEEAQLVSLLSLRLMAAIPKVNSALIKVMPAVCCWKTAVTCVYWKAIARKKSFSIKRAAWWSMGQPQRSW